jgi:hypothetical protein
MHYFVTYIILADHPFYIHTKVTGQCVNMQFNMKLLHIICGLPRKIDACQPLNVTSLVSTYRKGLQGHGAQRHFSSQRWRQLRNSSTILPGRRGTLQSDDRKLSL